MTTQHIQPASERLSLKRLLIGTAALPAAAVGLMMAFAVETSADAHEYEIAPTILTYLGPFAETLSGVFSISGGTLSSVDLTISGSGPAKAGAYTVPYVPEPLGASNLFAFTAGGTNSIYIKFTAALTGQVGLLFAVETTSSIDPAYGDGYCGTTINVCTYAGFATGAAAVPAVPEPSSIAILGAALGLFGLRRRATLGNRRPSRESA